MRDDGHGPADAVDLVQLFNVEVVPDVLMGSGEDLVEVLAAFQPLDAELSLEGLPQSGWRVIRDRPARESVERDRVFPIGRCVALAAPHHTRPDGWALIEFVWREEQWRRSVLEPGPVWVRPGKAIRRRSLRLFWYEEPIIGIAGEPLWLRMGLQNVSDQPWTSGDSDGPSSWPDRVHAVAWLLDGDGHGLPARQGFTTSGPGPVTELDPGQTVTLTPQVLTRDVESLPPGEYRLTATLISLNLKSEAGTLRLITPDGISQPTYAPTDTERAEALALPSKYYGIPRTVKSAEVWITATTESLGTAFDPTRSFASYPPGSPAAEPDARRTAIRDECLTAARDLLGDRVAEVHQAALTRTRQQPDHS